MSAQLTSPHGTGPVNAPAPIAPAMTSEVPLGRRRPSGWPVDRGSVVIAVALAIGYLATRLWNLGLLPMVSDEGTYIDWGVRAWHARGLGDWLASLEDGKQPLLAWLMPPVLAAVPDRLIAGRLVSVGCGAANVALMWATAVALARPWGARVQHLVGPLAAALTVVAPVALIHDRMALYDSLVTTASLMVLLATLRWADAPTVPRTLLLGLAVAIAVLTKLSALFFVGLAPAVAFAWQPKSRHAWWRMAQAGFIGAAAYSVLYLSPLVDNLADGNFGRYSLTAAEVAAGPVDLWRANIAFVGLAMVAYLGWPLTVAIPITLAWLTVSRSASPATDPGAAPHIPGLASGNAGPPPWRVGLILAGWVATPLLAFALTAKLIYSRYLVFCLVGAILPVAIATAIAISTAWSPRRAPAVRVASGAISLAITVGATVSGIQFGAALLTDPTTAPWMNDRRYITDRFQYVESNYAGYGLGQVLDQLAGFRRENPKTGIVVLTRTNTGMPRDGVFAYLRETAGTVLGIVDEKVPVTERLRRDPDLAAFQSGRGAPTYYILTDAPDGEQQRRFEALNPDARLIMDVPKPGDHSRFKLFQISWTPPAPDVVLDPAPILDDAIALRGFRLESPQVRAGATARVILYWTAEAPPPTDLTTFVHIVVGNDEAGGDRIAQRDVQPVGGTRPTGTWRRGDFVGDAYDVVIPPGTAPGSYRVVVGMYQLATMRRVTARPGTPTATDPAEPTPAAGMAPLRAGDARPWPNLAGGTLPPGTIDGENRITLGTVIVE